MLTKTLLLTIASSNVHTCTFF